MVGNIFCLLRAEGLAEAGFPRSVCGMSIWTPLCPIVYMERQKERSWQPWSALEKAYVEEASAGGC